ncbi:hypothetical protein [Nocardia brasiliensis]|uniref:hypothetical protein n=1 Tax=Nocardia brasiliensis TaxID=37326 RepID=UPI0004A70E82|nr:hypothetical protein [Nocardia brasiliensis]
MSLTLNDLTFSEHHHLGTCIEEAAHAIGAVLAGARVSEITASATAGSGRVVFSGRGEHGAAVAYWGIYARALFENDGDTPSSAELGVRMQLASAADLKLIGDARPPRHIEPDIRYAMPKVRTLARHLYRHGSATHADVERVLGIGSGVSVATVASCIRSRAGWPVSGGAR